MITGMIDRSHGGEVSHLAPSITAEPVSCSQAARRTGWERRHVLRRGLNADHTLCSITTADERRGWGQFSATYLQRKLADRPIVSFITKM